MEDQHADDKIEEKDAEIESPGRPFPEGGAGRPPVFAGLFFPTYDIPDEEQKRKDQSLFAAQKRPEKDQRSPDRPGLKMKEKSQGEQKSDQRFLATGDPLDGEEMVDADGKHQGSQKRALRVFRDMSGRGQDQEDRPKMEEDVDQVLPKIGFFEKQAGQLVCQEKQRPEIAEKMFLPDPPKVSRFLPGDGQPLGKEPAEASVLGFVEDEIVVQEPAAPEARCLKGQDDQAENEDLSAEADPIFFLVKTGAAGHGGNHIFG